MRARGRERWGERVCKTGRRGMARGGNIFILLELHDKFVGRHLRKGREWPTCKGVLCALAAPDGLPYHVTDMACNGPPYSLPHSPTHHHYRPALAAGPAAAEYCDRELDLHLHYHRLLRGGRLDYNGHHRPAALVLLGRWQEEQGAPGKCS